MLSPWERFAIGLIAVAKPDARHGEGLKLARDVARRLNHANRDPWRG